MAVQHPLINPQSKQFWINYVTTAQYDAGKFLNETPSEAAYQDAVKNKVISHEYRPIILNYTDRSWNWDWSTRNTTVVKPTEKTKKKTEEEKKEERAGWAKVAGVVFVTVGSFIAAYTYKAYSRQAETARFTRNVDFSAYHNIQHRELQNALRHLIYHQIKIDELNSSKINNYFLAAIGVVVGGGALVIGGFGVISWLITAGQLTLVASAAFAAANLGLHWNDHEELRQHYVAIAGDKGKRIQGLADRVLIELYQFTDDMKETYQVPYFSSSPPPVSDYSSLYPNLYSNEWSIPAHFQASAPPMGL